MEGNDKNNSEIMHAIKTDILIIIQVQSLFPESFVAAQKIYFRFILSNVSMCKLNSLESWSFIKWTGEERTSR